MLLVLLPMSFWLSFLAQFSGVISVPVSYDARQRVLLTNESGFNIVVTQGCNNNAPKHITQGSSVV